VINKTPRELWEETKDQSGITKEFFGKYFKGREFAYAYKLGAVTKFSEEKTLADYGCKNAPQSFVYVN
jgi:predicted transcriptional regulator